MHTIARDPILDLAKELGIDKWELVKALIESNTTLSCSPVNIEPAKDKEEKEADMRTFFGNL